MRAYLNKQISNDLTELCVNIGDRHPGSSNNLKATDYVFERLSKAGFNPVKVELDCIDWEAEDLSLMVGSQMVQAYVGPYSKPCQVKSKFEAVSTLHALESEDFTGKIIILHGELCKEQLAPKNYVFYNPDHHKQIIALLEKKGPLAILAITGCNPQTSGALSPFPLIEDADFDIPTVYLSEEEGNKILNQPEAEIHLKMNTSRIPSKAYNVIGVKNGKSLERIVFCAHIDTKKGTPGAIDNGGGVSLLLSLAELLKDYSGMLTVELLIINGEDHYAYPGGMRYLSDNLENFKQINLLVNSDGAGSKGSRTTYCYFNVSENKEKTVNNVFQDLSKFLQVDPWIQSDHAMFAMHGVPAVALTTEDFEMRWSTVAHTSKDTIDLIDVEILADTALALKQLVYDLNEKH